MDDAYRSSNASLALTTARPRRSTLFPYTTLFRSNRETGARDKVDFGHVGDVVKINSRLLTVLLDHGYLPVISSLGADDEGMVFNINADTVAAEIAVQMQAEKLILLSDVDGIYLDAADAGSKLSRLTAAEADELVSQGAATGGMIPKLQSITTL